MQLNLTYEEREGYLRVVASGQFSPSSARNVFEEWVSKAESLGLSRVLVDITQIAGLNTDQARVMTRFDLAVFVADSLPPTFRLAVLLASSQMLEDRFDENVMTNRGAIVKMATCENEAVDWLMRTSTIAPAEDVDEQAPRH